MFDATTTDDVIAARQPVAVRRRLRWFFSLCSGLLLAGLIAGFAPTFFLRGYISLPFPLLSLPLYLITHGVVLTTWFALVLTQSILVAAHRTDLHRRLGIAGAVVAVMVVPTSVLVVVRAVPRFLAVSFPREGLYGIILGDFVALSLFCVFVGAALYTRRRRTDIHKRLMIASCFTIYGPVLSRLGTFYGLHSSVPVAVSAMFAALAVYDVLTLKRIHGATLLSAFGAIVVFSTVMDILIRTGVADAVIDGLR